MSEELSAIDLRIPDQIQRDASLSTGALAEMKCTTALPVRGRRALWSIAPATA